MIGRRSAPARAAAALARLTLAESSSIAASTVRRSFVRALVGVAWIAVLSGCAARYQLLDEDLEEAKAQDSLGRLRVYPSNRTISVYDEPASGTIVVNREIRERSTRDRKKRILTIDTSGAIVGQELLNGARLLWITFDRTCAEAACAYGFVQTEDGRYRLVHAPERAGYAPPKVYRGWVGKRRQMTRGNLRSLGEANTVYRLERRRPRTVFLEVKRAIRKRVRDTFEKEPGV
jgi:hypothetical protein